MIQTASPTDQGQIETYLESSTPSPPALKPDGDAYGSAIPYLFLPLIHRNEL